MAEKWKLDLRNILVRDNATRVNAEDINPRLTLIVNALNELLGVKLDWEEVVRKVQVESSGRIDAVLLPVLDETKQALAEIIAQQYRQQTDFDALMLAVDDVATKDYANNAASYESLASKDDVGMQDGQLVPASLIRQLCPIGEIISFAGGVLPSGIWLPCDGTARRKVDYPDLPPVLGDYWGVHPDPEFFYLPHLIDKFDRAGNAPGQSGGQDSVSLAHSHTVASHVHSTGNHTLSTSSIPSHGHGVYALVTHDCAGVSGSFIVGCHPATVTTSYVGGSVAHNHGNTDGASPSTDSQLSGAQSIVPGYTTVLKLIRAKWEE